MVAEKLEIAQPRTANEERSLAIVNRYVAWASGSGLIPIPFVDVAAIALVQLKMIEEIASVYGITFSETSAKAAIGSIIGGTGAAFVALPVASLVKVIPFVGTIAGLFAEPAAAYATTWALGKVFIMHFESGGTLLDLNPDKMRAYFMSAKSETKNVTPKPATA